MLKNNFVDMIRGTPPLLAMIAFTIVFVMGMIIFILGGAGYGLAVWWQVCSKNVKVTRKKRGADERI